MSAYLERFGLEIDLDAFHKFRLMSNHTLDAHACKVLADLMPIDAFPGPLLYPDGSLEPPSTRSKEKRDE